MAKILVSGMAYDKGKSGISVYINNVLECLSRDHQLDVMMLEEDIAAFPVRNDNLNFIPVNSRWAKPVVNMLWHLFVLPLRIKRGKYDFIFLPAGNRRALLFNPAFTITTVHDLSQYHVPCKYDIFRMFYIKRILPYCVRHDDRIVAVSGSTRNDLVEFWRVPPEKITVNYNGYDARRFNRECDDSAVAEVKRKFAIRRNYILYISRIEYPGKNHINLIKAYEKLPDELKEKYELVLGGSFWAGAEPVKEYAAGSPDRDSINFIGFVPNEELPALYHGASLYVFPSFFEGFGLSLVEAMACGVSVACSNNSSLGEIGGEAALQFDPDNPEEISECMSALLQDEELRDNMIEKGMRRAENFDWQKHAEKIVELYGQRRKTAQ
jgi:glycosyltransferase involved in cell wall biosynthesis